MRGNGRTIVRGGFVDIEESHTSLASLPWLLPHAFDASDWDAMRLPPTWRNLHWWGEREPYERLIVDTVKDWRVLLDWVVQQPQFDRSNIRAAGYSACRLLSNPAKRRHPRPGQTGAGRVHRR